jgi:hypothetical protein
MTMPKRLGIPAQTVKIGPGAGSVQRRLVVCYTCRLAWLTTKRLHKVTASKIPRCAKTVTVQAWLELDSQ